MISDETRTVVQQVRSMFATPETWIQGHYAKNKHGFICTPDAPEAVCWCLEGAFLARLRDKENDDYFIIRNDLKIAGLSDTIVWNDVKGRTYQEVIDRLDSVLAESNANPD